jgi:hypothetical protein
MWKTYTRNAPMKINGEDILVVLELQDNLLDKNVRLLIMVASLSLSCGLLTSFFQGTEPIITNVSGP